MNRESVSSRGDPGRGAEASRLSPASTHRLLPITGITLALAGLLGCSGQTEAPEGTELNTPSQTGEAESALGSTPTVCVKLAATDANISAEKTTTNYGSSSFALSGASGTGVPAQFAALFQFDTAGIPVNATVVSATISLSQTNTGAAKPAVHLVAAPWTQGTVTWASLGGAFVAAPFTSFSLTGPTITFNVAPQAQDWIKKAVPNHGIYVEQNGSKFQTRYKASEYQVPGQRPALDLCYKVLCPDGFADCNNNAADGCEASLDVVPGSANCGACGVSCPPSGEICPQYCNGFGGFTCPLGLVCSEVPLTPGEDALSLCVVPGPCTGIGNFTCPTWSDFCADDPTDACDSGVDPSCPGRCVPAFGVAPQFCGGVMGLACPGGQSCHDIPCDGCVPGQGGVDCMGACGP